MLSPGDTFGRYAIEAVLGEGGMGRVYRAEDTTLARQVALKILHADNADTKKRMLREARAAAALSHPNVVAVFDVGEIEGVPFLAMEYLEGKPLRSFVGDASVTLGLRVRWLCGIARALAEAHRRGLVHRDVKPENVMITEAGAVKVLDFGIARLAGVAGSPKDAAPLASQTTTGAIVGTPRYMAPEQMLGEEVDGRADQFAWGVLAFELLTGAFPWGEATDAVNVIARALSDSRLRLVGRSGVPDEIAQVVDRALEREPARRFASMDDVATALARLAVSDTVAIGSGSSRPIEPRRARGKVLRVLAVGAALAVAAGVMAAVVASRRAAELPAAPTASAASSTPAAPLTMTDAPPPVTTSHEAVALYSAALQKIRDGDAVPGLRDLRRATELDPSFAAAHLRHLCYGDYRDLARARRGATQVATFRARLHERDVALLSLCEVGYPNVPNQADVPAIVSRARETVRRFPLDAEIALNAGAQMCLLGQLDEAKQQFERAAALDPKDANARIWLLTLRLGAGDSEGALVDCNACIATWPRASTCFATKVWLDSILGRCDDMDSDARAWQSVDPTSSDAAHWIGRALASRGAPPETVRHALERATEMLPKNRDPAWESWYRVFLASWAGDLVAAEKTLEAMLEKDSRAAADDLAAEDTRVLLELELEAGDIAKAKSTAQRYLDGLRARLGNAPGIARPMALMLLRREHALSEESFRALRAELAGEARPNPLYANFTGRNALFYDLYASVVQTPDEAREALQALPEYSPLPKFVAYTVLSGTRDRYPARAMGMTYFLAGRYDEAVPHLRAGVAACDILHAAVEHMRARVALGRALEAKGDTPGACAEYRFVLDRWPAPKPRSVSVDTARARMAALRCAK